MKEQRGSRSIYLLSL